MWDKIKRVMIRKRKIFKFGLDLKVIWEVVKEPKKYVTIKNEMGKRGNIKN